jgi:hypothetical protein
MNDSAAGSVEQSILEFLDGPTDREEIESSLDYPGTEVRSALREMLYSGQLATTPDWKYECTVDTDSDRSDGGEHGAE